MKTPPAKLLVSILALGLHALLYSGCASGFTREPGAAAAVLARPSPEHPVAEIAISLAPEVREKLKDSLKFDQETLRKTVELALSNQQLIDASKKGAAPTLRINVTHVRVRNTFNAVMWGAMSGNDSIHGEVSLVDAAGATVDHFNVKASYALGGWGGGQDGMRMNWLYEAFAKEVVKAISGEAKKAS